MTEYLKIRTVYTKDNCPACVQLKANLAKEGVEFKEVKIGRDITVEAFKQQFPHVRSVPYTIIESGE
jgi:glutaredoxin